MGVTVNEATETLKDSVLHGGEDYEPNKLHRAIRASGNRLIWETMLTLRADQVTVSADSKSLDVSGENGMSRFLSGQLTMRPFVTSTFKPLEVVSFDNLRRRYNESAASGRPEVCSWLTPTQLYVYPEPDQDYTLTFVWWEPLTEFEIGTTDGSTELNIPDLYVDDWLHWGARAYLLYGSPADPDGAPAFEQFMRVCEKIRGKVMQEGVWYTEPENLENLGHGFPGFV